MEPARRRRALYPLYRLSPVGLKDKKTYPNKFGKLIKIHDPKNHTLGNVRHRQGHAALLSSSFLDLIPSTPAGDFPRAFFGSPSVKFGLPSPSSFCFEGPDEACSQQILSTPYQHSTHKTKHRKAQSFFLLWWQ